VQQYDRLSVSGYSAVSHHSVNLYKSGIRTGINGIQLLGRNIGMGVSEQPPD
jgi:hypothetical protein